MNEAQTDRVRRMKVTGTGRSSTRTDVSIRGMSVTIDEPPDRGGGDAGPTPPETLLAALAGCTNRICHKIADASGIEIHDISISVDAGFDRRGVNLEHEIDVPFPEIDLVIDLTTDADHVSLERLKADLGRFCPVAKILRQAGTQITETWRVHRG